MTFEHAFECCTRLPCAVLQPPPPPSPLFATYHFPLEAESLPNAALPPSLSGAMSCENDNYIFCNHNMYEPPRAGEGSPLK